MPIRKPDSPSPGCARRDCANVMWLIAVLALAALSGCDGQGLTSFVSADPGQATGSLALPMTDVMAVEPQAVTTAEQDGNVEATVEEGDIYRVLAGSLILNLNHFRGLQVIDFSDVEEPRIIGRFAITGSPVELYVVDDRAIVLLNDWRGYFRDYPGAPAREAYGGVVLTIDLRDPTEPTLLDREPVIGRIDTSRLVRDGAQSALYVAGSGWGYWEGEPADSVWEYRTYVNSYDASDGDLVPRGRLDLGGYVTDITATPEALLVARAIYSWSGSSPTHQSLVSIVDISDPAGSMIEGAEVPIEGRVMSQFNMDLHEHVLRVVSSSTWGDQTNHLETFDATDPTQLKRVDHVTFGDGQRLFATIFVGHEAFFVTYLRVDPFHAFEIDADGFAREVSEFVVSGWNDFFRPVFDETRLVGIGVDDTNGRRVAVSLYDIEDLTNADPLIARGEVAGGSSWSEAAWDHRAFSVLEGVVDVAAPDGTRETGLVLLPFSRCCDEESSNSHYYGTQIFTFSDATLTLRGAMEHPTPVRRSFQADAETTANLSNDHLSLFDTLDPDDPIALGQVDLSVNYRDFFVFGDYGARVSVAPWTDTEGLDRIEIVSLEEHPDSAPALTDFTVPAGATLYQVGRLLVSIHSRWTEVDAEGNGAYVSQVDVHDLSDPTAPQLVSSFETDRITSYPDYYPIYPILYDSTVPRIDGPIAIAGEALVADSFYRYPYPWHFNRAEATDRALVFLRNESELVPIEPAPEKCAPIPSETTPTDEAEATGDAETTGGDAISIDPVLAPECWTHRNRLVLEVLDLSAPADPRFADHEIEFDEEDIGVTMLVDGSDVWLNLRRRAEDDDEGRPQTRYFVRRLDLSDPAMPESDAPINVPGELLAIEGTSIYTRDTLWSGSTTTSAVARLELMEGFAVLLAKRAFPNQVVYGMKLDGAGHLLIDHYATETQAQHLTILDAESPKLDTLASLELAFWARLEAIVPGRALMKGHGGVLVYDIADPAQAHLRAYFETPSWSGRVVVAGRRIIVPAHRYGIHAFDLDEENIPTGE